MSLLQLAAGAAAVEKVYADDNFASYTYTGNGSTQTITNGIDLASKGGMVWIKDRGNAIRHNVYDSARGAGKALFTNTTGAEATYSDTLTAFETSGFSLGEDATVSNVNQSAYNYISWTFRKAPKFFDVVTYTGDGVAGRTIAHSLGIEPGFIVIKRTNAASQWVAYHRAAGTNKNGYLNTTDAFFTNANIYSPTSMEFTVGNDGDVNANTATYVAYLFAHDTSTDGIIQCGSFTTDGSGNATVNLGWEPQYVMCKASSGTYGTGNWRVWDTGRGYAQYGTSTLYPNLSNSEDIDTITTRWYPTATGFVANQLGADTIHIYMAIRRPNKPPTSGTQVYNAIARTGTGAAATVTGVGFAPDLVIDQRRSAGGDGGVCWDRLRGANNYLFTRSANAEANIANSLTAFGMDGISVGSDAGQIINVSGEPWINWFFRRAPGVFSVLCDTGTGSAHSITHDLGVAPELWLRKSRSGAAQWVFGSSLIGNNQKIVMPSPAGIDGDSGAWNNTYPSSTSITVGVGSDVNTNGVTYVTYLWASLNGISRVGSYVGNGTSQTINCNFTTGSRFVMIIRTTVSTAQDIFLWDHARGIIASNDPHLSLNTTAAEVTTDDSLDPDNTGFIVNQVAATNINVNGATYLYLSYA